MLNAGVSLAKVSKEPNNKVVIFEKQTYLLKRILKTNQTEIQMHAV